MYYHLSVKMYSYRKSIKSDISDELINTYLLRPVAGLIVWLLYYTPVTANQVTAASILSGLAAAFFYLKGTPGAFVTAGLLITLKDLLDSADGQLARAKQQSSRTGRFLDSIGDFIVNAAVFSAIGWVLFRSGCSWWMLLLALSGLLGITLRVSYHVFYQVKYLHLQDKYLNNRSSEEIRAEDLKKGGIELALQQIFIFIYGWQDRLMMKIDNWCSGSRFGKYDESGDDRRMDSIINDWYSDKTSLRISGLLGFGTEYFLLMVCSVLYRIDLYLYLNLFLMNSILIISILYKRYILIKKLPALTGRQGKE